MIERKASTTEPEQSLEHRLAALLDRESVSANELAAAVDECKKALDEITLEKENAFDPRRWPDVKEAIAHQADCEFRADRLRTLLPELRQRYQQVAAAEFLSKWHSDADVVETKRDALAAEWAFYPEMVARLVDLLTRSKAFDEEISRLHQARPAGVPRHLLGAELVARGLEAFSRDTPSITKELTLPDWNNSGRMAWPPPRQLNLSALMPPQDPRFGPDWCSPEVLSAREAEAQAERERMAKYYEHQTRLQEQRINREERERFAKRTG
jgi:hypothetical protein